MGMLDGRVVIVTGGGRGIGRSHCLELASHGAVVVVNDLGVAVGGEEQDASPADELVDEIEAMGGHAIADRTSVTDFDGVHEMINRTVEMHGRLDGVVNNAGILRDRTVVAMSEAEFDAVIAVHVKGTFNVIHHAAAYWRDRAKAGEPVQARIVNTTSGSGLWGNVGQVNYGGAKAAIALMTITTSLELERYGITVNCISPVARTRMTETVLTMPDLAEGEFDPYDPANASPVVAWLLSENSGWLTGSILRIDGASVQRVKPWQLDEDALYRSPSGGRIEAKNLDVGMRVAFGTLPGGLAAIRG